MTLRTLTLAALLIGCGDKDDTAAQDTAAQDTAQDTADASPDICPGSEDYCNQAESHCNDDEVTMEICMYLEDQDCIQHFQADCTDEGDYVCVEESDTLAACSPAPATTEVRFINITPEAYSMNLVDEDGDEVGTDVISVLQTTAYMEATNLNGTVDAVARDAHGNELGRIEDVGTITEGSLYTLSGDYWAANLLSDDATGIEKDQVRVQLISSQIETTDVEIHYSVGWNGVEWEDGEEAWETIAQSSMDYGTVLTGDYDFSYLAHLTLTWEVGGDTVTTTWNFSYFVQDNHGTLIDAYFWYDGDCSKGSSDCNPQLIALTSNSDTVLVERLDLSWD